MGTGNTDDLRTKETEDDPINPRHYRVHPSGVECIDIIEWFTPNVSNAVKYLWRAGLKSPDAITDLQKAAWYVQRETERLTKMAAAQTERATPEPRIFADPNVEPPHDIELANVEGMILRFDTHFGSSLVAEKAAWWWINQRHPSHGPWTWWVERYGPWTEIVDLSGKPVAGASDG